MSLVRKLAVAVLTLLLTLTLVSSTFLAGAHLTVLDPTFVSNTVEEEGGYEIVENATVQAASSQVPSEVGGALDTEALVRDAIDQSYLQNQTERNVEALYAYLHGNADTLNLTVETEPLKESTVAAVREQVRTASVAELIEQSGTELPGPINQSFVERMTANESSYDAVKTDFRQQIRDSVLDEAVQTAWDSQTDDEKLALVVPDYNPDEYTEAEKDQMVADREPEIRDALRQEIEEERGDEIDQQVDTTLSELNATATTDSGDAEGLEAAAVSLQSTFVTGLTTDQSYDAFQSELNTSKATAAAAVGNQTAATLDEQLPDEISLTDSLGEGAQPMFEQAQRGVTWLDRIAIVAPLVALVLVGLVYLVTRSLQTVAASLGFSLVAAGLPLYLSLGFVQSKAEETVQTQLAGPGEQPAAADAGADLLLGVLGQLLGRIGTISLSVGLAGVALLALWLALRYEVISLPESTPADESKATEDDRERTDETEAADPAHADESVDGDDEHADEPADDEADDQDTASDS